MSVSGISVVQGSNGSLNGYECKCSCGLVMRSSLLTGLQADVAAHIAYHEKRGK